MTSLSLPITLTISDEIAGLCPPIAQAKARLLAELNLATLSALWYADESRILSLHCSLLDEQEFSLRQQQQAQEHQRTLYAKDVVCDYASHIHEAKLRIAVTPAELSLIQSAPNVVNAYLRTKLFKVLNLIARDQQLPPLPV